MKQHRYQQPEYDSANDEEDIDMIASQILDDAIRNSLSAPPHKEFNFLDSLELTSELQSMTTVELQATHQSVASDKNPLSKISTDTENDYDADGDEFDVSLSTVERSRTRRQSTGGAKLIRVKSSIDDLPANLSAGSSPNKTKCKSPNSSPRERASESYETTKKSSGSGGGFFSLTTIDDSDAVEEESKAGTGIEQQDISPITPFSNDTTTLAVSRTQHNGVMSSDKSSGQETGELTKSATKTQRSSSFLGMF